MKQIYYIFYYHDTSLKKKLEVSFFIQIRKYFIGSSMPEIQLRNLKEVSASKKTHCISIANKTVSSV